MGSSDGHFFAPAPLVHGDSFRIFDPSTHRANTRAQAGSSSSQIPGPNNLDATGASTGPSHTALTKVSRKRSRMEATDNGGDGDEASGKKWTDADLTNFFQFLFCEEINWQLLGKDRRAALSKVGYCCHSEWL